MGVVGVVGVGIPGRTLFRAWGSLPHRRTRHRRVGFEAAGVGLVAARFGGSWAARLGFEAARVGGSGAGGHGGSSQKRVSTTRRARRVARR
jgi:hypothetical protein